MTRLEEIAKTMGGEVRGDRACFPTPGHSKHDRGSTAELVDSAPDGVLICSYNGGDPLEIKDKLREAGVLPKREVRERCTGSYEFRDEGGVLLYRTERWEHPCKPKRYVAKLPNGSMKIGKVRRVLYRLPELIAADPAEIVFLPEGERKADKLANWGLVATAFAFGAKSWRKEYAQHLAGRRVVVLPDNDDEGLGMAQRAARDIEGAGGIVRIVELPGLPPKGDIIDWPGTREELTTMAASAFEGDVEMIAGTGAPVIVASKTQTKRGKPTPKVDGATLLNSIADFLGGFIAYPSEHCRFAHVLWIAHTHLMSAWDSTPRLAFLSPEPGSGKSRCIELTELLVPRPVEAVNVTPAYLFRKVADEAGLPTILFDEIDTVFGPRAKDNEELRGLLNAGHRRGAVAGRCVVRGKEVFTEELPAYCAVALAGLGGLPDTILTRSVIVRMRRRAPGEVVAPFRRREHGPDGHELRDQLASWAKAIEPHVTGAWPAMPSGIVDRDADVWEPLLAVADAAGGDWPDRARCSAVALVAASKESTPSLGLKLLTDLRMVFDANDFLATAHILQALHDLEESPWGDLKGKALDSRGLARRLAPYGVKPGNLRIDGTVAKGYKSEDLQDAWQRYLPPLPSPPHESATSATSATTELPCPRCDGEGCAWCEAGE